jgi:hypothetical protein
MGKPVAALEAMENRYCRLATTRQDVASELISYGDFKQVVVGRFAYGLSSYSVYPKFSFNEVDNYRYAAISHHREKSVDEFYGANETHQGARPYIQGSNKTARYINSFLKNSLAAKVNVIITAKYTTYTKVRTSAKITNPDIFNLNFICYFYCYHTQNLHPTSRRIFQKTVQRNIYLCDK